MYSNEEYLIELLKDAGYLSRPQIQEGAQARRGAETIIEALLRTGVLPEEEVARVCAANASMEFIDGNRLSIAPGLIEMVPPEVAKRYRVVPVGYDGMTLKLAVVDPFDFEALDSLPHLLAYPLEFACATPTALRQALVQYYGDVEKAVREFENRLGDMVSVDSGSSGDGAEAEVNDAPIIKLCSQMLLEAFQVRASDIHIEPQETRLVIRFRIDGVLHVQTEADSKIASALVLRLKLMSGLDISEKRLPQDGRFNIKVRNAQVDVRISTLPVQYGESVVMRLLNQSGGILTLDRLGMPKGILERVRDVVHRPSGMILVTGPTGSGKTTSLYAALQEINTPERKIITVEDPVEYRLPRINQVQVQDKIDLSFGRILRSALRQDPDVILVGEMRDQETAEVGLRAAMTGHMVLSTLHTNDAVSTPIRLLDMGAPRYMVAMSLHLVLAQRLVRVVCEGCIEEYRPLPGEYEWLRHELGEAADSHRYVHGVGCSQCNATGYLGRTGVYEMLEMTRPVVHAANSGDMTSFLQTATKQMSGHTLRRHASELAAQGRTTVEEAMRVSSQVAD